MIVTKGAVECITDVHEKTIACAQNRHYRNTGRCVQRPFADLAIIQVGIDITDTRNKNSKRRAYIRNYVR
jgi:hypothetical protein